MIEITEALDALEDRRLKALRYYADTNAARFREGDDRAAALEKAGLIEWRGRSFGANFYSITDAGIAALNPKGEE